MVLWSPFPGAVFGFPSVGFGFFRSRVFCFSFLFSESPLCHCSRFQRGSYKGLGRPRGFVGVKGPSQGFVWGTGSLGLIW